MRFILAVAPTLIILVFTLAGGRFRPPLRRFWTLAAFVTLAAQLLDWGMLAALPLLGLSYGPVTSLPLFLFSGTRLAVFIIILVTLIPGKQPSRYKAGAWLLVVCQFVLSVLAFYGMYIEPFSLRVTELRQPRPAFILDRPVRILHLTDIHIERFTKREEALLDLVDSLQPDLIVMTGDYINIEYARDPLAIQETRRMLGQLQAPYGVYAVYGSVDKINGVTPMFDGLPIRLLQDEIAQVSFPGGDLYLVGISHMGNIRDRQTLGMLMSSLPSETYSMLLYHTPDLIETAASGNIDLYLTGHTHGGQVRLPFYGAIATSSIYGKQYEMGLYRVNGTTLYVSRGVGMEGLSLPRLRFLCPPEIVLIEFGK